MKQLEHVFSSDPPGQAGKVLDFELHNQGLNCVAVAQMRERGRDSQTSFYSHGLGCWSLTASLVLTDRKPQPWPLSSDMKNQRASRLLVMLVVVLLPSLATGAYPSLEPGYTRWWPGCLIKMSLIPWPRSSAEDCLSPSHFVKNPGAASVFLKIFKSNFYLRKAQGSQTGQWQSIKL